MQNSSDSRATVILSANPFPSTATGPDKEACTCYFRPSSISLIAGSAKPDVIDGAKLISVLLKFAVLTFFVITRPLQTRLETLNDRMPDTAN